MLQRGLNLLIGAQWGSEGKGKAAAWLSGEVDVAVCDFGPNAGHTASYSEQKFVTHQVPMAAAVQAARHSALPTVALLLPESVIDVEQLLKEIKAYKLEGRLLVDARCAVVMPHHKAAERLPSSAARIASTQQGVGAARAEKISRADGVTLACDVPELKRYIVADTTRVVRSMCEEGKRVLYEMAQGFDLSLNHGHKYPHVTSRDVTVGVALNAAGCPPQMLKEVIAVVRTYPIRVGALEVDGKRFDSGGYYPDQHELTWESLSEIIGRDVLERTTTTNRVRRIFTWSRTQWEKFVEINRPTAVIMNFCDYVPEIEPFIANTGIPLDSLWVSASDDPNSIRRW